MSITNPQVIDIWAIPTWEPDNVVLIISDHLEWGGKAEQGEHLQLLQDKLNTYVAFIESGEIYTEIPNALGSIPSFASTVCTSYQSKASFSLTALPRC